MGQSIERRAWFAGSHRRGDSRERARDRPGTLFGDNPETNRASGNFGRILATITNARVLQFVLKYSF